MPFAAYSSLLENIGFVYDVMYGGGDDSGDKQNNPPKSKGTVSANPLAQARAMGIRGVPKRM